ncbi:MAG TPA: phosphotransferase [Bacillota bacterium]|nr:phosphotransferase [Bacillota bacterium]
MSSDPVLRRILAAYGLHNGTLSAVQKGYRNESHAVTLEDGRRLNLILYKSEPGIVAKIKNAEYVASWLHDHGLVVRTQTDKRIVHLQSHHRHKYGALYSYLPGKTIPWEAYTQTHIKALGGALSDMHAALTDLPRRQGGQVANEYLALQKRMHRYFTSPNVCAAMEAKLGLQLPQRTLSGLVRLLKLAEGLPGQHWLHMDFVRGNILFAGERISGVIDFEKCAWGHPLFDIARTLAFLIVDCKYKSEEKVRKYFLHSGYTKRGASSFTNIRLITEHGDINILESMIDMFLVYDFYKFLLHNPYEYLGQNEHYLRTVELLTKRQLAKRIQVVV